MTSAEALLQRVSRALTVYLEVASELEVPLLKADLLREARGFIPGLLEEIHTAIVKEACNDREPLTREQSLLVLKEIQDNQDFVVVFRTMKDDIREMFCRVDRSRKVPHAEHDDIYKVWDTEKQAPRSFRLDRVFSIRVTNI